MSERRHCFPMSPETHSKLNADYVQPKPSDTGSIDCRSCGFRFTHKGRQGDLNGNFCSMRCQDWYDAGNPTFADQQGHGTSPYRLVAGPTAYMSTAPMREGTKGWWINCKGCQKEFESLGLRCCSDACERRYRDRLDNEASMAATGMEPLRPKRLCEACGTRIPLYRNKRKVSSKTRFCSPRCQKRGSSR